jgi:NAD(P)-dependent dehydrogenase (short-subunit alcohol dehydrogenase family)
METNLNACFLLSKLAAQSMVKQRVGKIINIASEFSRFGSGLAPAYSASKGAVVQLTKSMAIDRSQFNIQVNAIAPGWVDTDMLAPLKTTPLYELGRLPATMERNRTPTASWHRQQHHLPKAPY